MSRLLIFRGPGPHYLDGASAGTEWDYSVTGEDLFPTETIQASTWEAVSGCIVSNVIVEDTKTMPDGSVYENVITARIGGLTSGVEAITKLTLVGDSSAQMVPFDIRIPVTS